MSKTKTHSMQLRNGRSAGSKRNGRAPAAGQARAQGAAHDPNAPVLITGGAGFIGSNLANRILSTGRRVIVLDNLSRPGVEQNLAWLKLTHGDLLEFRRADVLDRQALEGAVERVSQVFHMAAQVAVTTSLVDPIEDFEINARGTINVLEAIRRLNSPPSLVFTSTNKVYGGLDDIRLHCDGVRYEPDEADAREHGFSEQRPVEFRSPYGCSKGAADQYVLDYARTFGISAVVFRMSCIYGPRQFGTEDQGWVAHFLIRALERAPITVYGDGKQVRDILFVDDAIDAFLTAQQQMPRLKGQAFNLGGGIENTISLLELLDLIRELNGIAPEVQHQPWRPADQQYYVSDIRKLIQQTGWKPHVTVREGVQRLHQWLRESEKIVAARHRIVEQSTFHKNGRTPDHLRLEDASRRLTQSESRTRVKLNGGSPKGRRAKLVEAA